MTKKEAYLNVLQVGSVDDSTAEMYLISNGITPEDAFNGDLDELELAAIPCLQSLLSVSSVGEGVFSESRSIDGIKDRLVFLAKKHGMQDLVDAFSVRPKVRAYNDWGL